MIVETRSTNENKHRANQVRSQRRLFPLFLIIGYTFSRFWHGLLDFPCFARVTPFLALAIGYLISRALHQLRNVLLAFWSVFIFSGEGWGGGGVKRNNYMLCLLYFSKSFMIPLYQSKKIIIVIKRDKLKLLFHYYTEEMLWFCSSAIILPFQPRVLISFCCDQADVIGLRLVLV